MKDNQETSERSDRTLTALLSETAWQTPQYTVVETALEVTAYSLSTR
ncbi:pyrroloquinoline quinone precursor peptide PqqA [Streptomyces sp. 21So2-11]